MESLERHRPHVISEKKGPYETIEIEGRKYWLHRKTFTSDLLEIPQPGASSSGLVEIKQGMKKSFERSEFKKQH